MAAHRYWRILRRHSGDTSWATFAEIEMRLSAGGADQTSSANAIYSSQNNSAASNAFDNNTATFWQVSGGSAGAWIGQDFGAGNDKDIVEIAATPLSGFGTRAFSEFDVQYSDDSSAWTTAWSVSTTWTNAQQVFTKPSAVASRYWRIRANQSGVLACSELELRETVGGSDATGSGTANSRSLQSGFPASNAFDNNTTTDYVSTSTPASVTDSEWISYDFGSGVTKTIQQFSWVARDDGFYTQAPPAGWVESSSDAVSWLSRFTFSGLTWSTGSTNVYPTSGGASSRRRMVTSW